MSANLPAAGRAASSDVALALWHEYKATGDVQARNRLLMTYAPLVKHVAFEEEAEGQSAERSIACGLDALLASIDRFEPEKAATLEQFAWTSIRSAVLEGIAIRSAQQREAGSGSHFSALG